MAFPSESVPVSVMVWLPGFLILLDCLCELDRGDRIGGKNNEWERDGRGCGDALRVSYLQGYVLCLGLRRQAGKDAGGGCQLDTVRERVRRNAPDVRRYTTGRNESLRVGGSDRAPVEGDIENGQTGLDAEGGCTGDGGLGRGGIGDLHAER